LQLNKTITKLYQYPTIAGIAAVLDGVGGTNVHVVLEEYPQELSVPAKGHHMQLITWSAKTEASADKYRQSLSSYIKNDNAALLADIAYTLQTTRTDFNNRYFLVADSKDSLSKQLDAPLERSASKTLKVKATEVAFMFPGQGAQYVNMGRELYEQESVFTAAVNECVALLKGTEQEDILQVIFSDSADASEKLKNTLYTQPAVFIISYAMAKLWISWGIKPAVLTGHSIGEFVAGHFAGIFSLPDAVKLIAIRAKMVSELPAGSMISVRLSESELKEILPATLSIAVVNASMAAVAAGPVDEVNKFVDFLTEKGIANRVLQTSHAFHSSMMDPIVGPFEEVVKTIKLHPPVKPIISTITGTWMSEAEATDPKYWANHLRSTVRFADLAGLLSADKGRIALEVGPGKVLATLVKQQAAGKPAIAITGIEQSKNMTAYGSVLRALGQLWLNGIDPDWKAFYSGQKRENVNVPICL
jgi:acyl transferase domain-containing protein